MTADEGAALDAWAELVERLAVLLAAGLAPAAAWRHLAREGPGSLAARVAEEGREGAGTVESLLAGRGGPAAAPGPAGVSGARGRRGEAGSPADPDGEPLRVLAATWRVAAVAGAPLAPALVRTAEVLRELAEGARELGTALAGPRATSRIVLALPPLGLLLAAALGIDALGALLGTVPGLVCLALGLALLLVASRWNGRMLRAAAAREAAPGLPLELLAIALAGGMPPERALATATAALAEAGLPAEREELERQLGFARRAGVPVGGLARAAAAARRRRARAQAQRRAAVLATRLVLPLGLCVLPAFVLLGVAPLGIAIVSSTVLGW